MNAFCDNYPSSFCLYSYYVKSHTPKIPWTMKLLILARKCRKLLICIEFIMNFALLISARRAFARELMELSRQYFVITNKHRCGTDYRLTACNTEFHAHLTNSPFCLKITAIKDSRITKLQRWNKFSSEKAKSITI